MKFMFIGLEDWKFLLIYFPLAIHYKYWRFWVLIHPLRKVFDGYSNLGFQNFTIFLDLLYIIILLHLYPHVLNFVPEEHVLTFDDDDHLITLLHKKRFEKN